MQNMFVLMELVSVGESDNNVPKTFQESKFKLVIVYYIYQYIWV